MPPKIILAIGRDDAMPWELVLNIRQYQKFQQLQQVIDGTDWEQKPQDNPDQPSIHVEVKPKVMPVTPQGLVDLLDGVTRRQEWEE